MLHQYSNKTAGTRSAIRIFVGYSWMATPPEIFAGKLRSAAIAVSMPSAPLWPPDAERRKGERCAHATSVRACCHA